jgi:hypothetical protein
MRWRAVALILAISALFAWAEWESVRRSVESMF